MRGGSARRWLRVRGKCVLRPSSGGGDGAPRAELTPFAAVLPSALSHRVFPSRFPEHPLRRVRPPHGADGGGREDAGLSPGDGWGLVGERARLGGGDRNSPRCFPSRRHRAAVPNAAAGSGGERALPAAPTGRGPAGAGGTRMPGKRRSRQEQGRSSEDLI